MIQKQEGNTPKKSEANHQHNATVFDFKDPQALQDPIYKDCVGFQNLLNNIFTSSVFTDTNLGVDIELETKIEICKMLNFVMDWRVEFLISNAIEWWKDKQSNEAEEADATEFLPPIMQNGLN